MTHASVITALPSVPITASERTYHLDSTHILSTSWGTSHQAGSRKLWQAASVPADGHSDVLLSSQLCLELYSR